MRRFLLHRVKDLTGVSGLGVVAEGVQFSDGTVVVRWRGETQTTTVHESLASVERVHLHGGATRFLWCDPSWHGPRQCTICAAGEEPRPGISKPTDWILDGWGEPNGVTDRNGVALFVGQQVKLWRLHGEISNVGEVTQLYADHYGVKVTLLGTDCSACAYDWTEIEAIETTTEQTRQRCGRKPSYGWAPAIAIGADDDTAAGRRDG